MATTTKSTKKSATTKKKATTKKTTAKKPAAKKVAAVKPKANVETKKVANTTPNKNSKVEVTPLERIRNTHFSLTLLYAVFAGLVVAAVSTVTAGMTIAFQAKDQFASNDDNTVLGPASEVVFNADPKFLLVGSLVIGAISALFLATKLRTRYEATLVNRTSGFRWLITGVTSALLVEYVGVIAGITDILVLKVSAALILATSLFAFIAERDNVGATKPKWLAYIASVFTGLTAWLPIAGALVGTTLYGQESYEPQVYAIAGLAFVGCASIAINQCLDLKKVNKKDYLLVEARYWTIDMFTKFAVVLITLIAFK